MSLYSFIKPKSRYQSTSISNLQSDSVYTDKTKLKINRSVPQEQEGCQTVVTAGVQQNIFSDKLG